MNINFKTLYFDTTFDIADVLTSIGIEVKIGTTLIKWAHSFGDLGGEPEALDCTPLSALVRMQKAGLVEQENWTVDYWFNEEDYQAIETLKSAQGSTEISVTFHNAGTGTGTKFTNSGVVRANYLTGQEVNQVAEGHAVIELSGANGWTMTPAT